MSGLYDKDGIDGPFERGMATLPARPPTALEAITLEAAQSSEPFREAFEFAAQHQRRKRIVADIRNQLQPIAVLCHTADLRKIDDELLEDANAGLGRVLELLAQLEEP